MLKLFYFTCLYIFILINSSLSGNNKICSVHSIPPECPLLSACYDLSNGSNQTGECICDENYELNPSPRNDSDYCIPSRTTVINRNQTPTTISTTTAPAAASAISAAAASSSSLEGADDNQHSSSKDSNNKNVDKTASAISQPHEPPGSGHLIGGILIPIFLVVVILGLVYGVRRLNVIKRVHDMMISRRNRPFYEDVMMSNDNDDPPLI